MAYLETHALKCAVAKNGRKNPMELSSILNKTCI